MEYNLTFATGHGYWDVTKYPYGGDFKRFLPGQTGRIIPGPVKYESRQVRVEMSDGRVIVVEKMAVDQLREEFLNG
jgi:hypothetical protein